LPMPKGQARAVFSAPRTPANWSAGMLPPGEVAGALRDAPPESGREAWRIGRPPAAASGSTLRESGEGCAPVGGGAGGGGRGRRLAAAPVEVGVEARAVERLPADRVALHHHPAALRAIGEQAAHDEAGRVDARGVERGLAGEAAHRLDADDVEGAADRV